MTQPSFEEPISSITPELDPITLENEKLREEDLNNLSYSQLQDYLIKRNITPDGIALIFY